MLEVTLYFRGNVSIFSLQVLALILLSPWGWKKFLSNLKTTNTLHSSTIYATKFETLFIIMCCILSRTISCVSSYASAPIAWTSFFHPQGDNSIKASTCKENIETFPRKYNVTSSSIMVLSFIYSLWDFHIRQKAVDSLCQCYVEVFKGSIKWNK